MAWHGQPRPGAARRGTWFGKAGRGDARRGKEPGTARHGVARPGKARQGKERGAALNTHNIFPMKTYNIIIKGENALLMHHDNIRWESIVAEWQKDPANKGMSVNGDDRTPAFKWVGYLYEDKGLVCMPSDNLMTMLREGGAKCPTGKRGATFKRQTQSGLLINEVAWPITVPIEPGSSEWMGVAYPDVKTMAQENDFSKQEDYARGNGYSLFVKRARVGDKKHVRVRPRFDSWSISGNITVIDETITKETLTNIITFAGRFAGLGDWRPSSPKSPGPFGRFSLASIKEV